MMVYRPVSVVTLELISKVREVLGVAVAVTCR